MCNEGHSLNENRYTEINKKRHFKKIKWRSNSFKKKRHHEKEVYKVLRIHSYIERQILLLALAIFNTR